MSVTKLPIRRSIPFGIAAYVIGYLLSVGVAKGSVQAVMKISVSGRYVELATLGEIFGAPPSSWIVGGWLFYNAQFIPTSLPTADALNGMGGLTNKSLILATDGLLLGLFLVPVLPVFIAGYLTVLTGPTYGVRGESYGGASIALGYYPLLVIGAFVFTVDVPDAASVASPAGLATIFIGLVYPPVIGAIGGTIAASSD